jgi:tight adherence protein C
MSPALLVFIVALGVLLIFVALRGVFTSRNRDVMDRLEREVSGSRSAKGTTPFDPNNEEAPSVAARTAGAVGRLIKGREIEPNSPLRLKLTQAGFRQSNALEIFLGARILVFMLFTSFALWIVSQVQMSTAQAAFVAMVVALMGTVWPNVWLSSRIVERQKELNRMLPDAMDLIVICVEAGLSMDQAINRVGQEIGVSSPNLARELIQTGIEIEAGVGRADAFRKLALRTGIEDLRILAAMIIQSEQFGTSISKSLRLQSNTMRLRRMQKVEEQAAKIPSKMTLPLIFFILPSMFAVLMGPAAVRIVHVFAGD